MYFTRMPTVWERLLWDDPLDPPPVPPKVPIDFFPETLLRLPSTRFSTKITPCMGRLPTMPIVLRVF